MDGSSTFDKQVKKRGSKAEMKEIAGYPAAVVRSGAGGCMIFTDSSDEGFLFTNLIQNSEADAPVDLCQQAEKVTEAALQNVPNA